MDDKELYILSLFFTGYNTEYIKSVVKGNKMDNIINKYSKFKLIDS